mgnify:CR=1 FL=1
MKNLKINSISDLKKEGKSFYWASFFLPKKSKEQAGNLYSICRYFDNIADNDKHDRSDFLKESISEIKNNNKNIVNVFLKENNISIKIFADLIEGLIKDQKQFEIKNQQELIKYSYYVAGTVGLMMSKVIGVKKKQSSSSAIDLGIAMQMTNIARDVHEDANMKRIYIPTDWIPDINLKILSSKKNLNLEENIRISKAIFKLIDLSEKFYTNGFAGLKYIPLKTRLGILIAANIYRGIGIKIKKSKNKYLTSRIYLNSFEKTLITLKSISIFIFFPFLNYKYKKIRDILPNENI